MHRNALVLVSLALVSGCAAAAQNVSQEHAGAVVNAVHTPVDLAGPITLDRAVQVAIERHPLTGAEGHAVTEADSLALARVVRHRTTDAYVQYVRASIDEHVHADTVRVIDAATAVSRGRTGTAAATPTERELLQLESARLHLAVRGAAHDLELARAALNVELSRAPDAALGAPTETAPATVAATLDDLVARAMHTRQVLGHTVPEHVVRGEVAVALQHQEQAAENWRIFEAEAMPPATALMQGLQGAYTAGQINLSTLSQDLRVAFETPLERASRLAEVMAAASELEWVVGEPLARSPVPAVAPAAAASATAAPEAAAPVAAAPEAASPAPASPAPAHAAPAHAAPHAAPAHAAPAHGGH